MARAKKHRDVGVSILMPVFDTLTPFLADCWDSILAQTLSDWELVLVDDGSRAAETIAEINRMALDSRTILIRLNQNRGIAAALNLGLNRCRGKFVARMDADDTMLPTRLQRQFDYLETHADVTVLGTQMRSIEWKTDRLLSATEHPERVTDDYIEQNIRNLWFINHPTVMLRPCEVKSLGGYPSYRVGQDLGLWLKVMKAGLKIHNLPTVELHYRLHPNQVSIVSEWHLDQYAQIVEQCWQGNDMLR